ncbi:MAG: 6-phosphofructokinase [Gammaproteobacteria bacterium RIFCSPLOWO2_02_FULL_42_14]|nr:MAG: 6-phosphofructokinase [Gammaproteobacteria bacterium RIFCSPHIGHO2_02_FULL_42_43]OGT29291.1 MAG: 6-phosphofructokinase [Gammaproteobacteria bacterium RIFCSPHIGHO2_01_FULL_42_8]OGT50769.1 MAG: 6-phosphofructokinase [Gammaproteobacteria bacterium RIFCSPHIGHO2_12_FULL_41_25]OGT61754.1 MAG: 6-phosphofructokinase [Gammaproteobacteria bacterium RIFCSPLOWO2_02_FULL_42_14]OGT85498.1 MAG: 6-phosphofructokinase [Gammaproteobacteria bacterium RIFCSPLOWO2_12_FULL_42_18]
MPKNILYAQSGGPTAVINNSACGVIEASRALCPDKTMFAAKNGIIGVLNDELIDTGDESAEAIASLRYTPASAFGSCRYKLKKMHEDDSEYRRLIEVFQKHDIHYFFYNGGGDSQDTAHKVSQLSEKMGYPMACIGIPKTIDNDLPITDNSPGFGSVAKYIAISTLEAALDVKSMAASSTKIFVFEVMGRHAGWIAAASGLIHQKAGDPPHLILFPEIAFDEKKFLSKVDESVKKYGYCVIVASEGIRNADGSFIQQSGLSDAFGHAQLGGIAPMLAENIKKNLGYKYHWAVADYLQRAAAHIASKTDADQAYALGKKAVEFALQGDSNIMLTIVRESSSPYRWSIGKAPLEKVANVEAKMPRDFISQEGFGITEKCREYLLPLIQGEHYPPYHNGLPSYVSLKNKVAQEK